MKTDLFCNFGRMRPRFSQRGRNSASTGGTKTSVRFNLNQFIPCQRFSFFALSAQPTITMIPANHSSSPHRILTRQGSQWLRSSNKLSFSSFESCLRSFLKSANEGSTWRVAVNAIVVSGLLSIQRSLPTKTEKTTGGT